MPSGGKFHRTQKREFATSRLTEKFAFREGIQNPPFFLLRMNNKLMRILFYFCAGLINPYNKEQWKEIKSLCLKVAKMCFRNETSDSLPKWLCFALRISSIDFLLYDFLRHLANLPFDFVRDIINGLVRWLSLSTSLVIKRPNRFSLDNNGNERMNEKNIGALIVNLCRLTINFFRLFFTYFA